MRRSWIVVLLIAVAAAAFANGNAEKLTAIEGTVTAIEPAGAIARVMVLTRTREEVAVELPAGEIERLRISVQTQVRFEGVYIGVPGETPEGTMLRTRLMARVADTGEGPVPVEDPVQLTLRDRQQLRTWEREQLQDGDGAPAQTQTQTRTKTEQGTQAGKP